MKDIKKNLQILPFKKNLYCMCVFSHFQARAQTRKELESVHKKASELLAQYYSNIKHRRKSEQKREALLARLETDSELCACMYGYFSIEPSHEKTNSLGYRPFLTQTGLYSHSSRLEA